MPWIREGKCVYKKNTDGSKGELVGCSDSEEKAQAHLRALYANMHDSLHEFSMHISKASNQRGVMRWSAVNSDIDWDLYGERMTIDLYKKMLSYIENDAPPPEEFRDFICSDYWKGGMPYLSISHYPDLNGKAVPGEPLEIFIDDKQLKAKGILFDTRLGRTVWKSLKEDEQKSSDSKRIRISIAFLDLAHKHGEDGKLFRRQSLSSSCSECKSGVGDKIYVDGYLVHLALTTVPVNPRTIMMAEKSMTPKTRKQDAQSIVQDNEIVDEIDELAKLEHKSDILIEMSDAEDDDLSLFEEKSDSRGGYLVADSGDGHPALPTKENGKTSHRLMGAAWAALHGGYRGHKYEGKNKDEAISKLKRLYKKEGLTLPSEKADFIDEESLEMKAKKQNPTDGASADADDDYGQKEEGADETPKMDSSNRKKTKKSLAEEDIELIAEVVRSVLNEKKDTESENKSETENKSEVIEEKSALDKSVDALYNAINNALVMDATFETKLQSINPSLAEVGDAITNLVKGAQAQKSVPQTNDNGLIMERIDSLTTVVQTLAEEVKKKSETSDQRKIVKVPVPRSISMATTPTIAKSVEEKPNSIRQIARRSVGIQE